MNTTSLNETGRWPVMYGFKIDASIDKIIAFAKHHKENLGYCGYSFKEITKKIQADNDTQNGVECPFSGTYSKYSIVAKIINSISGEIVYCIYHGDNCYIESRNYDALLNAANFFHSSIQMISTEFIISDYKLLKKDSSIKSYISGVIGVERREASGDMEFRFKKLNGKSSVWFKESMYGYEKIKTIRI